MRPRPLLPILSALAAVIAVTALHPPSDDFHPLNPQWNGMELAVERLGSLGVRISGVHALDPRNYTLLIVGPSEPFALDDTRAVELFLARGGRVIVADDYGSANQLLEELGIPVRIARGILVDPILNIGSPHLPLAWWSGARIALNYAAALNTSVCASCKVLAESSTFSYLDLNLNGRHDEGEPEGPLPIAASLRVGAGELVVIADSSLFINSMIDRESNLELLAELLAGTRPALLLDRWRETPFATIKGWLAAVHRLLASPEIKYSLAAAVLALSLREGRKLARGRE